MTKHQSLFQRHIIRVLICFSLLTACDATAAFSNIDLSITSLDHDTTGFMITGNAAGDQLGYSLGTAGDFDNDGYDDIIISAYTKNSNQGVVYVIYGGAMSSMSNIALSTQTLDPTSTGFTITGKATGDYLGWSVSTAGDIDNDGYDDIIIGARYQGSNRGAAYVIYGGERSSMANIALSSALDPQTTGFMISGNAATDQLGNSVSMAGDIDNDGYADVVVAAGSKSSAQGAVYIIYGGKRSSMMNVALSTALDPQTTGFMISGNAASDTFGQQVRSAGDINNDGYDDIIVGAFSKNSYQGAAYVIYGGAKSSMKNIALSGETLDPQTTGFMITGNTGGDRLGISVSTAGDVNNDEYDDIIVGARGVNSNQGVAYVIYGGPKSSMSDIVLSTDTLDPTSTGFMITGSAVGDNLGNSVATAGDINNDGYDDIIVGAHGKNSNAGAAYIIYGGEKSSMTNIDLSITTLDPLTTGFTIDGNAANNYFGYPGTTAGDFNNDGFYDLIVGAFGKDSSQGAAYLITPAQCTTYCDECSSLTGCTKCKSPYLLYQFECLDSCPNKTFKESDTCKDCSTHCNLCSSASVCTECLSPYVLYKSYCIASCPKTMFNSGNVCKDCPSHCLTCSSQDSCQVCYPGYTLSNSTCVLSSQEDAQETATQALASATRGIGSVLSVGSSIFPFSALVSKIVQNTRYLNLSVTSDLTEIYQTWNTDLISWDVPNVMEDLDHFEASPYLFTQYGIDSPFLVNFWPTLVNIGIGFALFIACIVLQKLFEHEKYKGWAYNLVSKLVAGSFNFTLVQAYACLDDVLFYLVLDAKTNSFNSFFSWASLICAIIFLIVGCVLVFFNFWIVKEYQSIKDKGNKAIEAFNEKNQCWELFYSDFNDEDLWSQSFFATILIRSTLSSLIITVLYDYPLMQTSYLVMLDGSIILFSYFKTPFNTLRGKFAQFYYEFITLLVHICAFILSFQDSSGNPSDTVRSIMSKGIIYLNTALISGTIGFMFIELYKTISEKTRAARNKQKSESIPKDTQEIQNLNRKVNLSEIDTQAENREDSIKEKFHIFPGYIHHHRNVVRADFISIESSQVTFEADNSILSDMNSRRRRNQPRIQSLRPPQVRNKRQQRNRSRIQNHQINNEFSNNS